MPDQERIVKSSLASNTRSAAIFAKWSAGYSLIFLTLATLACLLPFSNKAFHMDDPLFLWTAQHIAQHPLDPYGFRVVWYATESPIAEVTKNPPLASYYAAAAGSLFGWSERSLHFAFLLPALAVVVGTYQLARRFTQFPLLAALATLLAPGLLVSSTTVMCDVLMLAFWMLAVPLWLDGTDSGSHFSLFAAALLIAACALTKYFGVALIPLLLLYSFLKKRRCEPKLAYLAIPILLLGLYQYWTRALYGRGLLSDAVQYASLHNRGHELSLLAKLLVGLAFAGGCALPALFFAPLLWSKRSLAILLSICGLTGLAIGGHRAWFESPQAASHWPLIASEMAIFLFGGISCLGLAGTALRRTSQEINADNLLLALWAMGTFLFAAFVNWTVNARSILPLIPVAAILLARRMENSGLAAKSHLPHLLLKVGVPLVASGVVALWVAQADANLANAGRTAAARAVAELRPSPDAPFYIEGHWGFQYYMQQRGALPADLRRSPFRAGDIVVIPENTTNSFGPPPGFTLAGSLIEIVTRNSVTTMSQPLGAGFYASLWGPLPFTFGQVPPERYLLARLVPASSKPNPAPMIFKP